MRRPTNEPMRDWSMAKQQNLQTCKAFKILLKLEEKPKTGAENKNKNKNKIFMSVVR